jgi:hypothetical protein
MEINLKSLNSLDDFKNLCTGLSTIEEFIQKYGYSAYSRFFTLKRYGKLNKNEKFPLFREKKKRHRINYSIEEINNIILTNNINSATDLITYDKSIYNYCRRNKLLPKLEYLNPKRININNINSINDLKDFIQKNKVLSKTDLRIRFPGLYNKFRTQLDEVQFTNSQNFSSKEILFMKELFKYGIHFIFQYTPHRSNFRYDFYLNDYNVVIEVHGRQHFDDKISKTAWGTKYSAIDRDKDKKHLLDSFNIPVYYFTYDKTYYNKYGYFDIVYTDVLSLFSKIGIPTNMVDNSWEEKFNDFTQICTQKEAAKLEINEYVIKNKITTLISLKKENPHLYNLVIKYDLKSQIEFSLIYSLDEINNIIHEQKFLNLHEVYLKQRGIYNIIKTNSWESRIVFPKKGE